jgi:hypothetical protein
LIGDNANVEIALAIMAEITTAIKTSRICTMTHTLSWFHTSSFGQPVPSTGVSVQMRTTSASQQARPGRFAKREPRP